MQTVTLDDFAAHYTDSDYDRKAMREILQNLEPGKLIGITCDWEMRTPARTNTSGDVEELHPSEVIELGGTKGIVGVIRDVELSEGDMPHLTVEYQALLLSWNYVGGVSMTSGTEVYLPPGLDAFPDDRLAHDKIKYMGEGPVEKYKVTIDMLRKRGGEDSLGKIPYLGKDAFMPFRIGLWWEMLTNEKWPNKVIDFYRTLLGPDKKA